MLWGAVPGNNLNTSLENAQFVLTYSQEIGVNFGRGVENTKVAHLTHITGESPPGNTAGQVLSLYYAIVVQIGSANWQYLYDYAALSFPIKMLTMITVSWYNCVSLKLQKSHNNFSCDFINVIMI